MTSKEALKRIKKSHYVAMDCMGIEEPDVETEEAIKTIEKDLDRLESLERQNELLKKNLKEYQEYIKKGVEEHYEDFMSDYDLLRQEYQELMKKAEILEIIKKSITHKENHKYVLNEKLKGQKFMIMGLYIKGDTDFKKIKEWLKNEKITLCCYGLHGN